MAAILDEDAPDRDYAGFLDRLWADFVDGIAATVLALTAYVVGDRWVLGRTERFLADEGGFGFTDAVLWAWLLWNMTWLVGRTGQSVGRKLVGITVVAADGGPIGFWRALGRNVVATFVSGPVLYLGFLWVIWDADKQAWHDKVFRTYVVKD